jgi:hypothetical protein
MVIRLPINYLNITFSLFDESRAVIGFGCYFIKKLPKLPFSDAPKFPQEFSLRACVHARICDEEQVIEQDGFVVATGRRV